MKTITIALVALLLAVPAAGQTATTTPEQNAIINAAYDAAVQDASRLPGSVADLRALRAQQDGPIVHLNGNTCFVSRAESYAPSCWPSRPEWKPPHHHVPWRSVTMAGTFAALAAVPIHVGFWPAQAVAAKIGAVGGLIVDAVASGDADR